jgi:hypothetical protein
MQKTFDNIPHPFMKKYLNKLGLKGTFLNVIIYNKSLTNFILNGKTETISSKVKKRVSTLELLARAIRPEKERKQIQIGKGEVELSLFSDFCKRAKNIHWRKDNLFLFCFVLFAVLGF